MKKLLIVLSFLLCSSFLFGDMRYLKPDELQTLKNTYFDNAILKEYELKLGATCTEINEIKKITKMKYLNLDDYFISYETVEEEFENPFYLIVNGRLTEENKIFYFIIYSHDNIIELYIIE